MDQLPTLVVQDHQNPYPIPVLSQFFSYGWSNGDKGKDREMARTELVPNLQVRLVQRKVEAGEPDIESIGNKVFIDKTLYFTMCYGLVGS